MRSKNCWVFGPGSFSFRRTTSPRLPSFSPTGTRCANVDEVIVEERQAGLEAVGHRELVLDHQQAVQERLGLEVERMVDVVLGPRQLWRVMREDVAEDVPGHDCRPTSPAIGRSSALEVAFGMSRCQKP